ncbi:MAG: hypothetical protein GY765_43425, partial [bacterium]|nr:hypothetical protein [bacterium]
MEKKDSPKGPPKKKSSLKANLILLLLSLVFSFFMAEIGARIFYKISHRNIYMKAALQHAPNGSTFVLKDIVFPSKNPRLFYELIPDRSGIFQGRPYGSNSHGLRGGETTVEKPAGTWRIASLGDSTMFGWAVKVEACYMSILEKTLNEAGD